MTGLSISRRTLIAAAPGILLSACSHRGRQATALAAAERLIDDLLLSGTVPAAGLVVRCRGRTTFAYAGGLAQGAAGEADALAFTPQTPMRVASVSKMAVALTAQRLAATGRIDVEADIRHRFSPALVHPAYPDVPICLRHLLMHVSGLQDPAVYWMPAPGRTEDLFTEDMWHREPWSVPGLGFRYCNLGYGLAAAIMERETGERFDRLARQMVLDPLGLKAGFNWSGVAGAARRRGATLYARDDDGRWEARTDGPDTLRGTDPAILRQADYRLEDYVPGTNGTLFSPQGGLRGSLEDMAALARAAAQEIPQDSLWTHDPVFGNGDADGGYFERFGKGVQWHMPDASPISGVWLVGHHGVAYGLHSGAFHAPGLDAEIAFAVTGTSVSGAARSSAHPVMVRATEPLWAAAATLLGA